VSIRALVREPAGEPEGALVLLHGRGADEHDLVPLLELLDPQRRLLAFTPRGPLALPPGGAHWYIVPRVGYPHSETFHESYRLLGEWLEGLPVGLERTVLGGFSQGAVMSLALGLGAGRPKPAAVIAFSGFLPIVEGWELETEGPLPPVAIGHGSDDPIIPAAYGRRARQQLEAAGAEVTYRESPLPHAIDPGFARELAPWVERALRLEPAAR
jgi:phospholipase/carboxylesterase